MWYYSLRQAGNQAGSGYIAFVDGQVYFRSMNACDAIGEALTIWSSNLTVSNDGHVTGDYYASCEAPLARSSNESTNDQYRYSFDLWLTTDDDLWQLLGTMTGHYSSEDYIFDFDSYTSPRENSVAPVSTPTPQPCEPSDTSLCLHDDKFTIQAGMYYLDGQYHPLYSKPLDHYNDIGFFYISYATNPVLFVGILNGCAVNGHYWLHIASSPLDFDAEVKITDQDGVQDTITIPKANPEKPYHPLLNNLEWKAGCP